VYGGKIGVMKEPTLDYVVAAGGETLEVDELDRTVGRFLGNGDRHGFAVSDELAL
jgi:hypothetical protein